jgi:hypothetical protein
MCSYVLDQCRPSLLAQSVSEKTPCASCSFFPQHKIPRMHTHQGHDPHQLDSFIGQSINQLSQEERNAALNEVHGVPDQVMEDSASMQTWLSRLDTHLNEIKRGTAYEIAETMDRCYVRSVKFRMMFLRAARHKSKVAAKRMIRFFEFKYRLFGRERLAHDITINDLSRDDRECLRNGSLQVLSCRDTAGRKIVVAFPTLRSYKTLDNELRAVYYILMSALDSEESQKLGATFISYGVGNFPDCQLRNGAAALASMAFVLPLHIAGVHICCNNYGRYSLLSAAIYLFPLEHRARLRVHFGSAVECLYSLASFGIPRQVLPFSPSFEPTIQDHLKWCDAMEMESDRHTEIVGHDDAVMARVDLPPLAAMPASVANITPSYAAIPMEYLLPTPFQPIIHIRREEFNSNAAVLIPNENDVLFGQGHGDHKGNQRLNGLINGIEDVYDGLRKEEKIQYSKRVVKQMQESGARFLKLDEVSGLWAVAIQAEAHKRVSKAFGNRRRYRKSG